MIIFLYGEDEFRSLQKLAEIKNKFLEKNKEGASLSVFDFMEQSLDISEVMMDIYSGSLFSPKKLVIIKNILSAKKNADDEKFEKFLKAEIKKENKDIILVIWEGEKFKKSGRLYKFLRKNAKCQEFGLLEEAKLRNWIINQVWVAGKGSVSINPAAVERLIVFVGNDLNLLSCEIEKLVSYKNKGGIGSEDIDLLVKSKINTDIFKTVDALTQGDKKTALKLLHEHLEAGEDPFYLLSMYFYQFRNLLKVKPLVEKNTSQEEIALRLKMHPFVVKKSLDQVRNFSWQKLKFLYNSLCEIDFTSKTGRVDIELAFDKFVAEV